MGRPKMRRFKEFKKGLVSRRQPRRKTSRGPKRRKERKVEQKMRKIRPEEKEKTSKWQITKGITAQKNPNEMTLSRIRLKVTTQI